MDDAVTVMAATQRRVYTRGSVLPFEEDETREFKGHRNIAAEDIPPWVHQGLSREASTRKPVSRNLNAFLNTGRGGTVYCGVDDNGRVLGMHLTRYQKDHVRLSVRDTLRRYQPAVPDDRHRITFVPVVSAADGQHRPREFAYEASRRKKRHLVATSNYCWCDAEAKARSHVGGTTARSPDGESRPMARSLAVSRGRVARDSDGDSAPSGPSL
ncbi:uncharacterized protein LOC119098055 [Pollicipes pollicipes]|uniref:uncharacterized protein LOC119098055 n=1 Tax=Pollicipes pollicipes TaxID=41117 RepID=UPI0018858B73|nr:uncharacterized protein LOC119098055 [Pollicipes pollicipes]